MVSETGYSRFPVLAGATGFAGYLHVKDILDLIDDPDAAVPPERVRGLPTVAADARLDVALSVLRRARAHLGRAVDAAGDTVGLVTMEDLIEHFVGTVRDATNTPRRPAADPGSAGADAGPPDGVRERDAGPVGQVRGRRGVQHVQVGPGAGAQHPDRAVARVSRRSAAAPPAVAAHTASATVIRICSTAVATQNAIDVV